MKEISRRDFIQTAGAGLLTMMPSLYSDQARVEEPANQGEDLCFMPATMLAAAIREKRVSPVEVINAVYARLHKINPKINAFCTLTEEQARLGKEAEAAVMRGNRIGPLHGVPVSIKDLFLTRGVRTMFGSHIRDTYIPDENAPVVDKLLAAGAISLGKTATPEFGFKGVTDSPATGITRNPWDLSKTPGGSSGGAGAAVATGLGQLAVGSDGAGSIRIPSSFCGIFGLKPSSGRVAVYPPAPVAVLAHAGPMTRTVRDAALMLNAISGPDERDLLSLPSDPTNFLRACEGGIRGLRVAWSPTLGYARLDPEVARVTEAAVKVVESSLGCTLEAADPGFERPWKSLSILWVMSYALRLRASLQKWENHMDPDLVTLIKRVERLNATDYGEAVANRATLWDTTRKFFNRFDLLLTPTLPVTAFAVSRIGPEEIPTSGDDLLPFSDWVPFTYPWNMTGQPAATVPCGFTRAGLPVGLQIIGRRFADATVLRAAAAFEEVRPWNDKRPLM